MMLDLHCEPMLEMIVLLKDSPWHRGYEKLKVKKCKQLIAYVERMRKHPILGAYCRTKKANDKLLAKWDTKPTGEK